MSGYDIVIPTVGRKSLLSLLKRLDTIDLPGLARVIAVDDGRERVEPVKGSGAASGRIEILRTGGRGPAAARNEGWRHATAEWVVFLDDDVIPTARWGAELADDLQVPADVAATQGRIVVPLPSDRRPTDWERSVAALEDAVWATADMAYRRKALERTGGFDERFPRAYREDSDLGLRTLESGWRIVRGRRRVLHPPGPAGPWISLQKQRGNADDALMRKLHGRAWRRRADAPSGRFPQHVIAGLTLLSSLWSLARGHRRAAAAGLVAWTFLTGRFAAERIAPGPRTSKEVARMVVTSVLIPPAALFHRLRGEIHARAVTPEARDGRRRFKAVLFDRDGTLIEDVPYNGDPDLVRPMPGAPQALRRLNRAGLRTAVISNQSGIGRGRLTAGQVTEVNRRAAQLLGLEGPWLWCPHAPGDGCECRKPEPGLVLEAASQLGVRPEECVVVGDIGSDVEAARAAGARGILVPTPVTLDEEVRNAPETATDIGRAVDLILEGEPR